MKLSEKEIQLLALLLWRGWEHSGCRCKLTAKRLAERYLTEAGATISHSTIYTTLRRLKADELVEECSGDLGDGRLRFLKITNSGVEALKRARTELLALAAFGKEGAA